MKLMLTVCEWVEVPQSHAISAAKNVRAEIQHVNKALFLCLCSSKQFRKYLKKNFSCLYRPANPLRNVTSSRSNAVNRSYWFHLISFQRVALSIVLKGKSEELKKKKKSSCQQDKKQHPYSSCCFHLHGRIVSMDSSHTVKTTIIYFKPTWAAESHCNAF